MRRYSLPIEFMNRPRYDSDDDKDDNELALLQRRPQPSAEALDQSREEPVSPAVATSEGDVIVIRPLAVWADKKADAEAADAVEAQTKLPPLTDDQVKALLRSPPKHLLPTAQVLAPYFGTRGPKQTVARFANRYQISHGWQWDGVDRSNGFENKVLAQKMT